MKKGQGQTISTFANHRIFRLSFCPFPMFSRCVLVLSFVLVCYVLVCSRLAFLPLSSCFPSVILPRGVDGHGSVPVSFPSASLAGGWGCGTVLSCPRPFQCPSLPPQSCLTVRSGSQSSPGEPQDLPRPNCGNVGGKQVCNFTDQFIMTAPRGHISGKYFKSPQHPV